MSDAKDHTVSSGTERTKGGDVAGGVSRRRFLLYATVGGAGLAVARIVPQSPERTPTAAAKPVPRMPQLREDAELRYDIIRRVYECEVPGENGNAVRCTVDDTGAEIIRFLDGNRTVEDLSERIASSGRWCDSSASRAEIAFFIAQLGMLGFLAKPFYAHICEIYTDAEGETQPS
jgi:hypothetical protein